MNRFDRWLGARWRGARQEHRAIARGLVLVSVFAFAGKLAGAAKEMMVAWRFGISAEVDAYLFAFSFVNWPVAVAFSLLATILIPLEAKIRADRPDGLAGFRREMLAATLIVGASLALVGMLLLPRIVTSAWVDLPPETAAIAAAIAPGLAWYTLLGLVVTLYSTWIMSAGGHANSLLEGVPALGILVALAISGSVEALLWGTLGGALVQLASSAAMQPQRGRGALPRFSLRSPHWASFRRGFGVMVIGQVVISFTAIVDQLLAARLEEGAISALGFSGRILSLVLTLVATAVTRATLPVFSDTEAAGARLRPLALRWSRAIGLAGVGVAAIGWLLAPLAVRLLFQRGTFDAADTDAVAGVLRYSLVQVPFYCASLVLMSMHASQRHFRTILASGILGLAVKVAVSLALLPRLGVAGLMLSYAAMYAANLLLFLRAGAR